MSMQQRTLRLASLVAAAALALGACGSTDEDTLPAPGAGDSSDQAGMRAPTPIRVAAGAAGGAAGEAATMESDDAAMEMPVAPVAYDIEYVVGDGLPALPTDDVGYVFEVGVEPTVEQVAALAAALGVEGEVVAENDGYADIWRVGPNDGSAPSLTVYGDSMLGWNFNSAWDDVEAVAVCATAGSPGEPVEVAPGEDVVDASSDEPAEEPVVVDDGELVRDECEQPDPPAGVPTAEEAEQRVAAILEAIGIDPEEVEFETFADDWFANVTAVVGDDVLGQARSWNFGFGGDAVLQWAGGSLAEPAPVGPFPLVDLDTAIARLVEGGLWHGGGFGGPGIAIAEPAIAVSSDDMVAEPAPPEGGTITITLVDVAADLWWVWDVEGSAWLLPAYRFVDADGGWHTVPAVTDEFLIEVEPDEVEPRPAPEPLPVEPGEGGSPEPAPLPEFSSAVLADSGLGVDDPALEPFLGLTVDEFERAIAAEYGWGPVRVAVDNGAWQDLEADLVNGRVNVSIQDVDGMRVVVGAVLEWDDALVDAPEPITDPEFPAELEAMMAQPVEEFTAVAESLGLVVRVVEADGEMFAITEDFVSNRVNIATFTRDGVVVVVNAFFDGGAPFAEVDGNLVNDWIAESERPVIVGVFEGVNFYPACGDESLLFEGVRYYQIQSSEYPDEWDRAVNTDREPMPENIAPTGFARVAPPGPGDDTGTLVIWDDGVAYFLSDSRNLGAWLTTNELEYPWTC